MQADRRQFLMAALSAPAIAVSQENSAPLLDRGFARVTRVADGVYVTLANPARGPQCLSNAAAVAARDPTVLAEGHFFPEAAELEIEVARMVSNAPVRAAVNARRKARIMEWRFFAGLGAKEPTDLLDSLRCATTPQASEPPEAA